MFTQSVAVSDLLGCKQTARTWFLCPDYFFTFNEDNIIFFCRWSTNRSVLSASESLHQLNLEDINVPMLSFISIFFLFVFFPEGYLGILLVLGKSILQMQSMANYCHALMKYLQLGSIFLA